MTAGLTSTEAVIKPWADGAAWQLIGALHHQGSLLARALKA